jgi:hypothetical protein
MFTKMHIHRPYSADYNSTALNGFLDRLGASAAWKGINLSHYHVKPLKTKRKKIKHVRDKDFDKIDDDTDTHFFMLPDDDSGVAPQLEDTGQVLVDLSGNDDDWGEEIQSEVAYEEPMVQTPARAQVPHISNIVTGVSSRKNRIG